MRAELKHTQINKTTFKWNKSDNEFRLTGYYFIYKTRDGENIHACVNKHCANAVSGVGVCGIILPIEDIKFTGRISKFKDLSQSRRKLMIDTDRWKYHFLKSLPKGLSKRQVDNRVMKQILDDMFPEK